MKEGREGYMREFGRRKWKGEWYNCNLKKLKK